jgi:hypothetical protein
MVESYPEMTGSYWREHHIEKLIFSRGSTRDFSGR